MVLKSSSGSIESAQKACTSRGSTMCNLLCKSSPNANLKESSAEMSLKAGKLVFLRKNMVKKYWTHQQKNRFDRCTPSLGHISALREARRLQILLK